MPKKSRSKGGSSKPNRSVSNDRTEILGSAVYVPSVTAGTGAILNLTPASIGGPAANVADNYTSYRIKKVQVTVNPFATPFASYVVVGVSVNISDVTAAGLSAPSLFALPHKVLMAPTCSVPRSFTAPSSYLIRDNAVKAVKTVAGSPTDWDEVFAQLLVASVGGGTQPVTIEVKVWFEFEGLVPTILTPAPAHSRRELSFVSVVTKMERYNSLHSDTHMEPVYDPITDIYYDVIKSGPFKLGDYGSLPPVVPLVPLVTHLTAAPHAVELLAKGV